MPETQINEAALKATSRGQGDILHRLHKAVGVVTHEFTRQRSSLIQSCRPAIVPSLIIKIYINMGNRLKITQLDQLETLKLALLFHEDGRQTTVDDNDGTVAHFAIAAFALPLNAKLSLIDKRNGDLVIISVKKMPNKNGIACLEFTDVLAYSSEQPSNYFRIIQAIVG